MALVMRVASHLHLPVSHPVIAEMDAEDLVLMGAQIEREQKEVDGRFGILATFIAGGHGICVTPDEIFSRLAVSTPLKGEAEFEKAAQRWAKGRAI